MENKKTVKSININSLVTKGTAVMVVVLLMTQFVVLAVVGTKGSEITDMRQDQQQIRLENESLRAKINSQRTLAEVEEIKSSEGLVTQQVKKLNWSEQVTAQVNER